MWICLAFVFIFEVRQLLDLSYTQIVYGRERMWIPEGLSITEREKRIFVFIETVHKINVAPDYKSNVIGFYCVDLILINPRLNEGNTNSDFERSGQKRSFFAEPIPSSNNQRRWLSIGFPLQYSQHWHRLNRWSNVFSFNLNKHIYVFGWNFSSVFNLNKNQLGFGVEHDTKDTEIGSESEDHGFVHAFSLVTHGLFLPFHRIQLPLHRSPLMTHYVALLSVNQDLGHYGTEDQHVQKVSGNKLNRIGIPRNVSTGKHQSTNNYNYQSRPAGNLPTPDACPSPPNPNPSPKARPSILWAIAGLTTLIIGLLIYPFLLNHTLLRSNAEFKLRHYPKTKG